MWGRGRGMRGRGMKVLGGCTTKCTTYNSHEKAMKEFLDLIKRPRVAASFWRQAAAGDAVRWQERGVDIAELHLDFWGAPPANLRPCSAKTAIAGVESYAPLPCIATARWSEEGGQWCGSEAERARLLSAAAAHYDAVDVELASEILLQVRDVVVPSGCALIMSRHNFLGADSLATMRDAAKRAFDLGADVYKNASMVETADDLCILKDFLQSWAGGPLVVTGMGSGDVARQARLELPACGSRLNFAAANGHSAPGQLSLDDTVKAVYPNTKNRTPAQISIADAV